MNQEVVEFNSQNNKKMQIITPPPNRKTNKKVDYGFFDQINERLNNFFSKGWNIARVTFFMIIALYFIYILISALSTVPEGESLTWSHFLKHLLQNVSDLRDNFPIFGSIFQKISNLISARQVNFLVFLSALFATLCLLVCLCP